MSSPVEQVPQAERFPTAQRVEAVSSAELQRLSDNMDHLRGKMENALRLLCHVANTLQALAVHLLPKPAPQGAARPRSGFEAIVLSGQPGNAATAAGGAAELVDKPPQEESSR